MSRSSSGCNGASTTQPRISPPARVRAGLTPLEALTGATRHAAAFLGTGGTALGAVREGAAADLLLVEGDPTQDISAIRAVRHVVANGTPVDLARLRTL